MINIWSFLLQTLMVSVVALFVLCMFLGVTETILYAEITGEPMWMVTGPSSVNFSNLVTIEILCLCRGYSLITATGHIF